MQSNLMTILKFWQQWFTQLQYMAVIITALLKFHCSIQFLPEWILLRGTALNNFIAHTTCMFRNDNDCRNIVELTTHWLSSSPPGYYNMDNSISYQCLQWIHLHTSPSHNKRGLWLLGPALNQCLSMLNYIHVYRVNTMFNSRSPTKHCV